jgi:hypothetical protein
MGCENVPAETFSSSSCSLCSSSCARFFSWMGATSASTTFTSKEPASGDSLALIELSDQLDHAITAGVELARQEGDFIAEHFIYTGSIRGGGSSGISHGGTCTTVIMSSSLFCACGLSRATVLDLFYRHFSLKIV